MDLSQVRKTGHTEHGLLLRRMYHSRFGDSSLLQHVKGHPERKLDFMFFSYHCDLSEKIGKGTKDLSILWNYYKIPGYNENNTYIVDDYDHVFDTQQHNTIIAPPFRFNDVNSENDNFLPELVNRLKSLRREMIAGDNRHSIRIINDGNEHN
jgi:hypothetical protein